MAALTSADVTVTAAVGDQNIAGGAAFKNVVMASITFGNGALTYPSGGVPLPAIGKFGFRKAIDFVAIEQPPGNGFVYKYDRANHKIRIYTQGILTGTTAATTNGNGALVAGSAGVEGSTVRIPNTAASTTYDLGPMIELPTTIAPASVTLKMLMIGD